jgi:hypothetical protein
MNVLNGQEMVCMTNEEFNGRIAEATERGYRQAEKNKKVQNNEIVTELVKSLARAILLIAD